MKLVSHVVDFKFKTIVNDYCEVKINVGTFWKPLAKSIGTMFKVLGYTVRYRGRGARRQWETEIPVAKAKKLAVYVSKNSKCTDSCC